MGNIFSALFSSYSALRAFQRALEVTQNNVANVNTPGYARQRVVLSPLPFDPDVGLLGGVDVAAIESARDQFLEAAVQGQSSLSYYYRALRGELSQLEMLFPVNLDGGLPAAISQLVTAFSALSVRPTDQAARQQVLDAAGQLAAAFRAFINQVDQRAAEAEGRLQATVDEINRLGARLASLNQKIRQAGQRNAAIEAQAYSTLEELAQLVDLRVLEEADGTFTVLLGGQEPLVIGEALNPLRLAFEYTGEDPAAYASASPPAVIYNSQGVEITGLISSGKLGGLLKFRNEVIPNLRGGPNQAGEINRLARALAERVNNLLLSGQTLSEPPQPGIPLFSFDASSDVLVARTLQLNPDITPELLATASPGPPYQVNGVALQLAGLLDKTDPANQIDGLGFLEFYSELAAGVGRQSSEAAVSEQIAEDLLLEAKNLRQQLSGVSLDEEAIYLIQFQRAYQAAAQVIRTLDALTEETVNLLS